MQAILDFILWAVIYLVVTLPFAIAMGKFIGFGMGETPESMPPHSMPRKD